MGRHQRANLDVKDAIGTVGGADAVLAVGPESILGEILRVVILCSLFSTEK